MWCNIYNEYVYIYVCIIFRVLFQFLDNVIRAHTSFSCYCFLTLLHVDLVMQEKKSINVDICILRFFQMIHSVQVGR